jgi:hypothetical protein
LRFVSVLFNQICFGDLEQSHPANECSPLSDKHKFLRAQCKIPENMCVFYICDEPLSDNVTHKNELNFLAQLDSGTCSAAKQYPPGDNHSTH